MDGANYTIPINKNTEKYNFAVKTSKGIVWSLSPTMDIAPRTEKNPFYYPTELFSF